MAKSDCFPMPLEAWGVSVRVQGLRAEISGFISRTQHTLVMLLEACYLTRLALLICKMGTVSARISKDR